MQHEVSAEGTHELLVEADGYRPLSTGLANVVGGRHWPLSKRVFDVQLVLVQDPIPNQSLLRTDAQGR